MTAGKIVYEVLDQEGRIRTILNEAPDTYTRRGFEQVGWVVRPKYRPVEDTKPAAPSNIASKPLKLTGD